MVDEHDQHEENPFAAQQADAKASPRLHDLFSGPLRTIQTLFDKVYKSKCGLRKIRFESSMVTSVLNLPKCQKELPWFTTLRGMQFSHPTIEESVRSNANIITMALNSLAATVYERAYEQQIQLYLADIKSIISATCANYDKFTKAKQTLCQTAELDTWLPEEHREEMDDFQAEHFENQAVSTRSKQQRELFFTTIQRHKLQLERRFSQLTYGDHLCSTLSAKFLTTGKASHLQAIRKKSKHKIEVWTRGYANEAQMMVVVDRKRKLYLDYNASIIALAPSMAIIRTRRLLIKSLMCQPLTSDFTKIPASQLKAYVLRLSKDEDFKQLIKLFDVTAIDGADFCSVINASARLTELVPDQTDFLRVDVNRKVVVPDKEAKEDSDADVDMIRIQKGADEREKARRKQLVDVMAIGVCNVDPFNAQNADHSLADHFKFHSV